MYTPAYSGLADTHLYLGYAFGRVPPVEAMPKARAAAEKALELDPNLAEARTSLGFVTYFYDWDWAGAERELREAIRLNPSYSVAHHIYAVLLMTLGRRDESVTEAQRALDVDPLSLPINNILGAMLANAGRYDEAIERYKRTLELSPNFSHGLWGSRRSVPEEGNECRSVGLLPLADRSSTANQRNGLANSVRHMRRRAGEGTASCNCNAPRPAGMAGIGTPSGSPGYLPRSATSRSARMARARLQPSIRVPGLDLWKSGVPLVRCRTQISAADQTT